MIKKDNILIKVISEKAILKFWGCVNKLNDVSACWEWKRNFDSSGYGIIWINSSYFKAHRVSYYLKYNVEPKNNMVCHKCDNRKCVNPNHLFLGDNKSNMMDMIAKGRGVNWENINRFRTEHPELITKGEDVKVSKLKTQEVLNIRDEYFNNKTAHDILAKKYNVARSSISCILRRKTWKHI